MTVVCHVTASSLFVCFSEKTILLPCGWNGMNKIGATLDEINISHLHY